MKKMLWLCCVLFFFVCSCATPSAKSGTAAQWEYEKDAA